jgi:hypothetical protein
MDPHVFRVACLVSNISRRDEGFGGDTSIVQADPTHVSIFDESHVNAKLSGTDRCDVATRPAADDDQVSPGGDISDNHHFR